MSSKKISVIAERTEFSERLCKALGDAGMIVSATKLSRAFNVLSSDAPVTVHAVRKWLVGEAIPTQDKLRLLADLVGVQLAWLRFGGKCDGEAPSKRMSAENVELLAAIGSMGRADRALVADFVRMVHRRAAGKGAAA